MVHTSFPLILITLNLTYTARQALRHCNPSDDSSFNSFVIYQEKRPYCICAILEMNSDPYHTPALHPPDGVEPEFHDYYPIRGSQIALATVFLTLSSAGVIARSYTRARILNEFDLSDWALILSLLLFAAFTALRLVSRTYGGGYHQWDVNVVTIQSFLYIENLVEALYSPTMLFAKYTVLRQIKVIFYQHQREKLASKVIWGLIVANSIFYVSVFFGTLFSCIPRAKIFNPSVEGWCSNQDVGYLVTSAINVVSDFTILIIPLVALWQLQRRPRAKFGAYAAFAVGVLATVACIVRLYYSIQAMRSRDFTWFIESVGNWAIVELSTVILVACCPLFPRFYKHLLKHDKTSPLESMENYGNNRMVSSHLPRQTPISNVGDTSSTEQLWQV
ncbi:hypothetical protein F4802DRAFT_555063 [Xylaria palmicola]|nr:hypothetical protein F4802DRAFT_555063 [Xylaria palmicola]